MTTRSWLSGLLAATSAILLGASPAAAQECVAPPGTAAVDQYCENVPSATSDSGSAGSDRRAPSERTSRAIQRSGESGRELNRFLGRETTTASTGSTGKSGTSGSSEERSSKSGSGSTEQPAAAPQQPSSNPLGAVQSAVNSGDTVGSGFIWAMIVLTLLMTGIAWMRYRRRSSS
jgi:hypothetical protein